MVDTLHSGATLATAIFVLGFFTLAIYLLRIWFRITRRKYDISDTLLSAAVLCAILQTTIWLILIFPFHHGKLKATIPPHILKSKWPPKLLYANQIIFKLTTPLCKLSLCFLYRSICATSTGRIITRTRLAIYISIALITCVYTSALIVSTFQCTPIRKIWTPKTPGHCIALDNFRYSTAIFNIITSLIVVTLPIPVLTKLKNHCPEIKQLMGLVLLGLVHTSLTIARFVIMFFPDKYIRAEPQYGWVPAQTLAVSETMANILFATLVVMRPAFQAVWHALVPRRARGEGAGETYRTNSMMASVLDRFRNASGDARRKDSGEACILERKGWGTMDVTVDVEHGDGSISR